MNSRSRSLSAEELYPHDEMRLIARAIEHALYPFKPGMIIQNMDETSDPDYIDVRISVKLLPKHPFKHRFSVLEISDSYLGFAEQIAVLAEQHFASLPRIPPEDHIILGIN